MVRRRSTVRFRASGKVPDGDREGWVQVGVAVLRAAAVQILSEAGRAVEAAAVLVSCRLCVIARLVFWPASGLLCLKRSWRLAYLQIAASLSLALPSCLAIMS